MSSWQDEISIYFLFYLSDSIVFKNVLSFITLSRFKPERYLDYLRGFQYKDCVFQLLIETQW